MAMPSSSDILCILMTFWFGSVNEQCQRWTGLNPGLVEYQPLSRNAEELLADYIARNLKVYRSFANEADERASFV